MIGTVSVIKDNAFGLPIDKIFDTTSVKAGAHCVAEISALAFKKEYSENRKEILFPFFKFLYQYCANQLKLDRVLVATHPNQTKFYETLFFFKRIQEKGVEKYDYVDGAPADGLYLDERGIKRLIAIYHPLPNYNFPNQSHPNYERMMTAARLRFFARITPFFSEKDPKILARFLIYFCSQGVGMTELVSDWICRAGKNTIRKGFAELGNALINHAAQEAGHHKMMMKDVGSLVDWWNNRYSPKLKSEPFLSAVWSPSVEAYRKLHEDYIVGETPYCQIAIEYEIENISVDYGPKLFGHLTKILGADILQCLTFIKEHVALDVEHTQYNAHALEKFVGHAPKTLESLVLAGARVLDCYATYLEECFAMAK